METRYSPSTLFVIFDCRDEQVEFYLEKYGLIGTKVSMMLNRYAVEVPYGEEEKYRNLLLQNSYVQSVSNDILKGKPRGERPKKKDEPKKWLSK